MEKISVIICTRNRPEDIIRCIESISIQTLLPDEIVVVDSSDTDKLKSRLGRFQDKIAIKYIWAQASLTQARNIGIDKSTGDIVVFFDDDVVLDKEYMKEIKRVFDDDTEGKVGAVTGETVRRQDHNIGFGYQIFATMFLLLRYGNGKFQHSGFPTIIRSGTVDRIKEVEYAIGAYMASRKKIIGEFKFDENIRGGILGGMIGDDDDVAYRLSRKYRNIYTPFAKLSHNLSPASRPDSYTSMKITVKDHHYLFKKNLPQDFKHKLAFNWSVIGLFVMEIIRTIIKRDTSGLKGVVAGVKSVCLSD